MLVLLSRDDILKEAIKLIEYHEDMHERMEKAYRKKTRVDYFDNTALGYELGVHMGVKALLVSLGYSDKEINDART